MKKNLIAISLILAGCSDRPAAPTAAQNDRLNEAEDMLDEEAAAHEKGPATEAADPNSN